MEQRAPHQIRRGQQTKRLLAVARKLQPEILEMTVGAHCCAHRIASCALGMVQCMIYAESNCEGTGHEGGKHMSEVAGAQGFVQSISLVTGAVRHL